jgi:hypothetical protein
VNASRRIFLLSRFRDHFRFIVLPSPAWLTRDHLPLSLAGFRGFRRPEASDYGFRWYGMLHAAILRIPALYPPQNRDLYGPVVI